MQSANDQPVSTVAPEEAKGGLQHYVLEVDESDVQRTSELVFIDNPVRNGPLRIVWLGICFFLLFVSYNVAQGAVTTLFPNHGFFSLALIYAGLMAGSVIAPMLIPRYLASPRFILFCVAAMHCLFVASINLGETALLVCSAGVGFSASFLWLQQGLYVTGVSQRAGGKIGKLTAIFFGIFNVNMIVGNLISLVIESAGSAPTTVIWSMTVIAGIASLAFLAVPNLPPAKVSGLNATNSLSRTDQPTNQPGSTLLSNGPRASLLSVCRAAPMRNLVPIILFSGAFVSFIFGTLPTIADPAAKSISVYIALAFVSYGGAAALGAFVWGRLFDWRGPRAILLAQLGIGLAAFTLFIAVLAYGPKVFLFPVVLVASALCGALETATTTLINTCISVYVRPLMSHKDSAIAAAFSLYRILYCCGFVFVSLVTAAVPRDQVIALWAVPLALNLLFLISGIASGLRLCALLPARLAASRSSSPTRPRAFAIVGSTPVYHEAMGDNDQDTDASYTGQDDEEHGRESQASVGELDVTQMHASDMPAKSLTNKHGPTRVASKASKIAHKLEARVTEMTKQTVRFVKGDFQKLDGREEPIVSSGPSSSGAATPAREEFDLGDHQRGN